MIFSEEMILKEFSILIKMSDGWINGLIGINKIIITQKRQVAKKKSLRSLQFVLANLSLARLGVSIKIGIVLNTFFSVNKIQMGKSFNLTP